MTGWIRSHKTVAAGALGLALVIVVALCIFWFGRDWWKVLIGWRALVSYIGPEEATDRKDAVQVYAVIVAGVVAGITATVGLLNLRLTRKNLEQQRELEAQRGQGTALQAYYEQIGKLITDKDSDLLNTERNEIRELARGQTLTVLQEVDGKGKGSLLTFLHGAGLIGAENPAVALISANLQESDLNGANFRGVNLEEANLQRAKLERANLRGANLRRASLQDANLRDADLQKADLQYANLQYANLYRAYLAETNLQGAILAETNLQGAKLQRANLRRANLQEADLREADLQEANLREADLQDADLQGANLSGTNLQRAKLQRANLEGANLREADLQDADLRGANLQESNLLRAKLDGAKLDGAKLREADVREADLRGAHGVTVQQLARARVIERATMPWLFDSQKYEDWHEAMESRKEDE
jgi:uncharacterized protein YjbI with pentapeptide repeats